MMSSNPLQLRGRLPIRFGSVFMEIFGQSSKSTFVRSDTDAGREGLAHSLQCKHGKGVLLVEVRKLCGSVKFFHTSFTQPCLHGPSPVHWCTIMLKQEGTIPLFPPTKLRAGNFWKMFWYAEILRAPFTETMGSPHPLQKKKTKKQTTKTKTNKLSPLLLYTWYKCSQTSSSLLAIENPDLYINLANRKV